MHVEITLPASPTDLEALRPLAGHPTLQEVRIDSYSETLQRAISETYGWRVQYANRAADEYLA